MPEQPQQLSPFDPRNAFRLFTGIHSFWYRMTGGLVGGWAGAPMLLLTTTGRTSGAQRTTPLVFLRDGDDLVIIASYGGADRHPDWWLNLRAHPEAEVQVFAEQRAVRAEEATGDERARLWERITRTYPIYRFYETRTSRQIPVVVLRKRA
jgi:deazaflavin-dependent oxidoreductase (nitroreductase family)